MRLAVTRPEADSERTAEALRARGHEVLLAPLMRVERVHADLSGDWSGVVITSANGLTALAGNPALARLRTLPVFAVGRRSAAAATGFAQIHSADGDANDLVRLIVREHRGGALLYLAGQNRAADLAGELAKHGIRAELRTVYRALTVPFPPQLLAALKSATLDGVLHFSRRSAENYVAGAHAAEITESALSVRHFCLSEQVAEPLRLAGATRVAVAAEPNESALLALLG
jgi:uroporphyrinogen-III synthase